LDPTDSARLHPKQLAANQSAGRAEKCVSRVDRTVDRLFEKLMITAIRANGSRPIPFIWFWPEGKQAAFILTHDVEDENGKAFCPSLMDIDDEYGFKPLSRLCLKVVIRYEFYDLYVIRRQASAVAATPSVLV